MHNNNDLVVTLTKGDLQKVVNEAVQTSLTKHLQPPEPLKVYPLAEACELLGVHRHTLRLYADRDIIHHHKVGNRYYFTLEAIQKFIENKGSEQPTQPRAYKKS